MSSEAQKVADKLDKMGRQLGYLAYKIILLSGKDMAQVKGNGLIITIKKWEDVINECEYTESDEQNTEEGKEGGDTGQVEPRESECSCGEETEEVESNKESEKEEQINGSN